MSKRDAEYENTDRPPKRFRREDVAAPPVEDIQFARQLQELLSFRQDGLQSLRHGMLSFKKFLEDVLYHREGDERLRRLSILREYLESQKPPSDSNELERPFLSQLWQAWSFASQNNNESLASSISALFAQLLKTLSGLLDFRDYGLLLGRTVLQQQHLRLLRRDLGAPRHKDFMISPCLRLLIEVTSFDGGVLAREVYKRREETFDADLLRRHLGHLKPGLSEEEARRRPAIRTLALRYVLMHFKYLHEGGKTDILKSRPLCNAIFQHIHDDPQELINEVLWTIEQSVLKDQDLPRSSKAAILTSQTLERLTEIATRTVEEHPVAEKAFSLLRAIVTLPAYGLQRQSGWYPPGSTKTDHNRENDAIDLGLDSLEFYDRDEPIQIRNTVLHSWIQTLRPQSNAKERELLIGTFVATPELVAAYFSEKAMQIDPKLSNIWIGYASLLFEVISLPVPDFFGNESEWAEVPPQTKIMMESILPRPLTQKFFARCLNQNNELITFFAVRILVLAFQKLSKTLTLLRNQSSSDFSHFWTEAADRVVQKFKEKCPTMKDIVAAFKRIPDDGAHVMQREAIARLLKLFYEVTPVHALEEQFDISTTLISALIRSDTPDQLEVREMRSLELEHLLILARHNPGMRWFHKQGALQFSPVLTLIKLQMDQLGNPQIRELLEYILSDHGILAIKAELTVYSPFDALLASLMGVSQESSLWAFVDDCMGRTTRQPIKYVDLLEAFAPENEPNTANGNRIPSPLIGVLFEQTPFVAAKPAAEQYEEISWIHRLLCLLARSTDKGNILAALSKHFQQISGSSAQREDAKLLQNLAQIKLSRDEHQLLEPEEPRKTNDALSLPFDRPPTEMEDHPELFAWSQKAVDLAIEDGDIGELVFCLSSSHSGIRKQAHTQLSKFRLQMETNTTIENAEQIALLIGELGETFEHQYLPHNSALPYLAGTFVTRALQVQIQPAHYMYPKLNHYLIRGPEWRVDRMPSYWISNTIRSLPEEDDAFWKEGQWVLDWFVDGLRTPDDLDIMRKANVFEKVMALSCSPGVASRPSVRQRMLELLFRATCVDGGSTTLITRTGVLSWLDMVEKTDAPVCAALRERIWNTCDPEGIKAWSGGAVISPRVLESQTY